MKIVTKEITRTCGICKSLYEDEQLIINDVPCAKYPICPKCSNGTTLSFSKNKKEKERICIVCGDPICDNNVDIVAPICKTCRSRKPFLQKMEEDKCKEIFAKLVENNDHDN